MTINKISRCNVKREKKRGQGEERYQFNPRVYADSDGINGFYIMPPVSGNKQDLKLKDAEITITAEILHYRKTNAIITS